MHSTARRRSIEHTQARDRLAQVLAAAQLAVGVTLVDRQVLLDVLRENVADLDVSWNRLFQAAVRIEVDVVPRSGSGEAAAGAQEFLDELLSLQTAMAFSRCRSGTSSMTIIL
jgi:hypothetical protein